LKVLFILHYPPPVHGSSVVGGYIKNSSLIANSFECRFINFGTSVRIDEIGNGWLPKIFRYLFINLRVIWQLMIFRPDLCYFTIMSKKIGFYKDLPPVFLARLFRRKIVYHFHNRGISERQDNLPDHLLYMLAFRNTDVLLLSKSLYTDVRKYFPENMVHYCANGIPEVVEDFKFKATQASAAGILFFSNLVESKGVYILLDALRLLRQKGMDFHCNLVGSEGDVSSKKLSAKVHEYSLDDFVTYSGFKSGLEKESIFRDADIFVHPSYLDCMPLVILEAMQHSLPVVSTFEGAIPDTVEDGVTGFLVQPKDPVALAEKLEILIRNPELQKSMGKAGREKYEKEFTIDRFENRLKEILQEVGDKNRRKAVV
jgi:glycosyltransferase involved in cell wall biosynthesis